eukprot:TRINITY_DN103042_c0_g1_i1.p1 TRINITY_DN103042_c0_g1~~TRINITY_DN103042_c0_g1_i1.p1  ORF type:complete len:744 (+),score=147.66 TRINITY_DN103042_c0_g1_i1:69-2234(+)
MISVVRRGQRAFAFDVVLQEGSSLHRSEFFAVPTSAFYKSVAMWCREIEVGIGSRVSEAFGFRHYVADFLEDAPASGLAFQGSLVQASEAEVEFVISRAVGPWKEYIGEAPLLQRIRLQRDASVPDRRYHCRGFKLQPESSVPLLDVELDTGMAYNWMRYPFYLHWARYIIQKVREESGAHDGQWSATPLVVDLGGGSGWMSTFLQAHLGDNFRVVCTDIAIEALQVAKSNADRNHLPFIVSDGDMFEAVTKVSTAPPEFIFFNPPQDAAIEGAWLGSPDVALVTPGNEKTFFHARFCREAKLAPGGVAWLGINWGLLEEVIKICCEAGFSISLPQQTRDITGGPSVLAELRHRGSPDPQCAAKAMAEAESAAEYQIRAVGARSVGETPDWYRRAANRGFATAQNNLGAAYLEGIGVEKNAALASRWFNRAARKGEEKAQVNLARLLASRNVPRHDKKAALWFRKAAEHGNADAQLGLGSMYKNGRGLTKSDANALLWWSRAAVQGLVIAQANVGECFARGIGTSRNDTAAVFWLKKAARQGHAGAQVTLGSLFAAGRGIPFPNKTLAASLFRSAAESGHPEAQEYLAMMFSQGWDGVPQDEKAATAWYAKAAAQGSVKAQSQLGMRLLEGRGVASDVVGAARWIKMAAERGDPDAAMLLAKMYLKGEGMRESRTDAARWLRVAAAAGGKGADMFRQMAEQIESTAARRADSEHCDGWGRR